MTPERWLQIESGYQKARAAATPEEQAAVLATLDPDLRREVEALLADGPSQATASMAMPIAIGAGYNVAHYRVESKLGEGGMGSVYRAVDTKLNRPVAIKFLADNLADAAARRRFQHEAQLASSLNHPHILTVHDAGEIDGRQYLVTEYVDGGTLRDWANAEPRTWKQVVDLLTGVADALAAAHQAGIVHRDIKPANILVAKNGYAKLADFGLAKLAEGAAQQGAGGGNERNTKPGMIVGTVAYMSPEQASGRPVDARSDIFSFGVVLYEMLAGQRPFTATNDLELLKTIIHGEPQPLPPDVPPTLASFVDKALEKDPADRYQTMRDLVVDLKRTARKPAQEGQPVSAPATPQPAKRSKAWIWIAAAAVIVAASASAFLLIRTRSTAAENPLANARYTRITDWEGSEEEAAISRDGRFVAFRSDRAGTMDTWVSQIGTGRFLNLTNGSRTTVLVRNVGFTADGSELWLPGSLGGDRMRLVPLIGGTPRPFLAEHAINVAWSPDGTKIVYHPWDPGDEMFIANSDGSNARPIYKSGPDVHNHFPTWSRDGQWIYFVSGVWNAREMDVWRIPVAGGTPERMTHHNADVRYTVALNNTTLLYVSPDENGAGPWLWALDTGTKISKRISAGLEIYSSVDVSGDGKRLVVTVAKPVANLWSVPLLDRLVEEKDVKMFNLSSVRAFAPRFGGKSLFYLSASGGGDGLWRVTEGQAAEVWRGADGALLEPAAVSSDGTRVAIILRKQGRRTLSSISPEGGDLRAIAPSLEVTSAASWSPDGKWVVAGGVDGKGPGLFKIPADGGEPQRIASGAAANAVWSPDGTVIIYTGPVSGPVGSLLAVRPDGTPVEIPKIQVRVGTEHYRFVPGRQKLIYAPTVSQVAPENLWILDLKTKQTRQLGNFDIRSTRTFDITPDGKQIVFDRVRQNSDIVLIELAQQN